MEVYLLDKVLRFKISVFSLLVILACGPKPEVEVQIKLTPEHIMDSYHNMYHNINSLALSGTLSIVSDRAYDCNLQLMYIQPDSFAFLAEGSFGIDIARGALVADSGFFEVPKERYHQNLSSGDYIFLDDIRLDINSLIQAVIFFQVSHDFKYMERSGSRFIYSCNDGENKRIIELNSDSFTPISQTLYNLTDTLTVDYYKWEIFTDDIRFPERIIMNSKVSDTDINYQIKKVKVNPIINRAFFMPEF